MNDQVDEIKSKVDIVSLISEYVELKRAGRNYKAPCPFHSEKTPSFMVSPELQIFKCFGCGESGDVFSFLQKYEGMEFFETLKYLAERTGVKLKQTSSGLESEREKLFKLNSLASYFYSYVLLKHPAGKFALNYLLKERRVTLPTIETFNLGFSPEAALALKNYMVNKKGAKMDELEKTGIVYNRDGRAVDRFRGRIIFPLFDHRGNGVGFAGRIIPGHGRDDVAKYINTPETEIYHKSKVLYGLNITRSEIKKSKVAVVVEGELDAISSYQVGIKNVVAIKGSAVTLDQAKLLSRFCQNVVLALDSDFAGNEAARRGLDILESEGIEVKVCTLEGFKDPDEAAHKDPEQLKLAIKNSKPVWDFVIDLIFSKHEGESAGSVSKELVAYLSTIRDEIVQAHYIKVVAERLGVPFGAVASEVQKSKEKNQHDVRQVVILEKEPERKTRREILEERLLSLIFKKDPTILNEAKVGKLLNTALATKIVQSFFDYHTSHKTFTVTNFSKSITEELKPGFSELIIKQIDGLDEESPESLDRELALVKKELNILVIKEKLEELGRSIRQSEELKDVELLKTQQEKFAKLTEKLNVLVEEQIKGIIS